MIIIFIIIAQLIHLILITLLQLLQWMAMIWMSYLLLTTTHRLQQLGNHTELASLHGPHQHHDLLTCLHETSCCWQRHHFHISDLIRRQHMLLAAEHYLTVQQCQMGCNINNTQQMTNDSVKVLNQEILCFRQTLWESHVTQNFQTDVTDAVNSSYGSVNSQWLGLMSHDAIQFNWYCNQTLQEQTILSKNIIIHRDLKQTTKVQHVQSKCLCTCV